MIRLNYGMGVLKIPDYWERGITGKGVKVGVCDSGISHHVDLHLAGGWHDPAWNTYYNDRVGHASHVSGIIAGRNNSGKGNLGIAYECNLLSYRINYPGALKIASLGRAIDHAIANKTDILVMPIHMEESIMTDATRASMRADFQRAEDNGLLIVVAAGNHNNGEEDNITPIEYLPKMPGVITVANFNIDNARNFYSGTGPQVDVAMYGSKIWSCGLVVDETSETNPSTHYYEDTGTSMASPGLCAILALYKQLFPNLGYAELKQKFFDNCKRVGSGLPYEQGYGVPQPPPELYELPIINPLPSNIFFDTGYGWGDADILVKQGTQYVLGDLFTK